MKKKSTIGIIISLLMFTFSFAQPTITSFVPTTGPVGTTITISGANFNSIPADNIVFFGATRAIVSAASTTSLTVNVPIGATYQQISVTDSLTSLTALSNQPFKVSYSCGSGINSSSFSNKLDFSTGVGPWGNAISDLDGDGKSDLVVANNTEASVSVFRNISTIGTINFATKVEFTTGSQPRSVSIGDLNGDGKPDLLTANICFSNISILQNTSTIGNISFASKVDYLMGGPLSATIGDLDGDGKLDIAVANWGEWTISVLRNTSVGGVISFAPAIDYPTGQDPTSIVIADLDGDNKPEMALVNSESDSVSIFKNTSTSGFISFNAKIDFEVGAYPVGLSIGDLDDDGKADLAIANMGYYGSGGPYSISVLRNTSTAGTISFSSKNDFLAGNEPTGIGMTDLDGDGKTDLTIANFSSNSVSIFKNTSVVGAISFSPKIDFTTGAYPQTQNIPLGDLDGDGQPEIVVSNSMPNTISVFRNIQCITNIFEPNEMNYDFSVYPNPFSTETTIFLNDEIKNATLRVTDLLGKEIKSLSFSGNQTTIEKGEMKVGIYFVAIIYENEIVANRKIIIQ